MKYIKVIPMGIFDKYSQAFSNAAKKEPKGPEPKFVKPDGTKIYEFQNSDGNLVVQEILPKQMMIMRYYDSQGHVYLDYIRKGGNEIGHVYSPDNKVMYEYSAAYNSSNVVVVKNEKVYTYHDNDVKSKEIEFLFPKNISIEISYDEKGKQIEKFEQKGSVKTYFDINDKPVKRVIDRGSGIIITEDLTGK